MAAIGIDFGVESCYVAVARGGGIETVDNDYSLRATPSYVAFKEKQRILGVAALNQQITNIKNTVYGFKRFIGVPYSEVENVKGNSVFPYDIVETGGTIGVRVNYMDEQHVFDPRQITAMLFTKLKETTEVALQTKVQDCVISCPTYFKDKERKALLEAATIAGFNVLRLMNDSVAAALTYGIYRQQDLPREPEEPRKVLFLDTGHSALQVYICAFKVGELKILASAWDEHVGGRDFAAVLMNHFIEEFKTKYGMDVTKNARSYCRLLAEVQKLKKQMSANSTKLPLGIECLMNEKDVSTSFSRAEFEVLAAPLIKRVDAVIRKCLSEAGLAPTDLHSVELVGGATRIPAIKDVVKDIFTCFSTTLNQDEAVARGCALQCAILSPVFKVRDFKITDLQPYPVYIQWDNGDNCFTPEPAMVVVAGRHSTPLTKAVSLSKSVPFTVKAFYVNDGVKTNLGSWKIDGVKPSPDGEPSKIKVKAKINVHGIFSITGATIQEKAEEHADQMEVQTPNAEQMDVENPDCEKGGNNVDMSDATKASPEVGAATDQQTKPKKKLVTTVDLQVTPLLSSTHTDDVNRLSELEGNMAAQDRLEKERIDAKNALEEYIYEMREKVEGEFREFVPPNDLDVYSSTLGDLANWLYEDGCEESRGTYATKLDELRRIGDPVKRRRREYEEVPKALDDLSVAISRVRKAIDAGSQGPSEEGLEKKDLEQLENEIQSATQWMENGMNTIRATKKYEDAGITSADVLKKREAFQVATSAIINKPKPQPAAPKVDTPKNESKNEHEVNGVEKESTNGNNSGNDQQEMECEATP